MRDEIYGEIQFVDDFDIERKCQKQFDALNLAIKHLRKNNYIPKSKIREKIEELEKKITTVQGEELLIFDSKIDILQELLEEEV